MCLCYFAVGAVEGTLKATCAHTYKYVCSEQALMDECEKMQLSLALTSDMATIKGFPK